MPSFIHSIQFYIVTLVAGKNNLGCGTVLHQPRWLPAPEGFASAKCMACRCRQGTHECDVCAHTCGRADDCGRCALPTRAAAYAYMLQLRSSQFRSSQLLAAHNQHSPGALTVAGVTGPSRAYVYYCHLYYCYLYLYCMTLQCDHHLLLTISHDCSHHHQLGDH